MKALIVVAHGSRRAESNKEMIDFTSLLGKKIPEFTYVGTGFLECTEPSIPTALGLARSSGAEDITIFPHFLTVGRHVAKDIPEIVSEFSREHPDVNLHLLDYLGKNRLIVDFSATHIADALGIA